MKISIQCSSFGQRCGISSYSIRLNEYLNKIEGIKSNIFVERIRNSPDVINIQYEPGLMHPQFLQNLINKYSQPIVVTAHHIGFIPQFYPLLDGIVLHSKSQIPMGPDGKLNEPWNYKVIPHPALVYPEKGKEEMKKKYGLPLDKTIIGTAGFIAGTGKELEKMITYLMKDLKKDEFLYFCTSFWKGGDFGFEKEILDVVKKSDKESQFRIDSDFVSEEILNEKLQACDLLFAWNQFDGPGSTSGIGPDMMGSRRKLIVKNSPHYSFVSSIKGVETGRLNQEEFVEDMFKLARSGNLDKDIPDPTPYSWQMLTPQYIDYFKEILGE